MKDSEEHIWIQQILNGNKMPFSLIVKKYQQLVFTIAFRIMGNREDAEDAAQEIFVKCYRGLRSFNRQSAFATWLYRIAYNHSIDLVKRKGHFRSTTEWEYEGLKGIPSEEATTESEMDLKTIKTLLKDAILSLPPEHRILVLLYYYQEMPLKEIAVVMGVKENNLKIRLHRIRAKLMDQLKMKSEIISILNL